MEHRGQAPSVGLIPAAELGIGTLLAAIRDAVVVADDRGRIVFWNPGAVEMFGYTPAEAAGLDVMTLVPEAFKAQHAEGLARYRETGHGALIDRSMPVELPAVAKGGRPLTIELTLAPIEAMGRRFALALLRDVSERARLRGESERRARDLQQANQSLEAFSYVVGHDLKEPLRSMRTYLELLEEEWGTEPGREHLERAQKATVRMNTMLKGLLEWSRASVSTSDLHPVSLDVILAGDAAQAQFAELVLERNAQVHIERPLPTIVASEPLASQILGNLIVNAIKHNTRAHPVVRIRAAPAEEGLVGIIVEDDGPGLPAPILSRRSSPSGFGLRIVERAVQRIGGRLEFGRSKDLGGAAVTILAPSAPARES